MYIVSQLRQKSKYCIGDKISYNDMSRLIFFLHSLQQVAVKHLYPIIDTIECYIEYCLIDGVFIQINGSNRSSSHLCRRNGKNTSPRSNIIDLVAFFDDRREIFHTHTCRIMQSTAKGKARFNFNDIITVFQRGLFPCRCHPEVTGYFCRMKILLPFV